MNKTFLFILIIILIGLGIWFINSSDNTIENTETSTETFQDESVEIIPVSHASLVLNWDDTVVYVDPVGGGDLYEIYPQPDIVLITHTHGDHFDNETLKSVVKQDTFIAAPQVVADELEQSLFSKSTILANGVRITMKDLEVTAVAMYNVPESEDAYHVRGEGNGYVIEKNNHRVYIAGDTSRTQEMVNLEDINTAFIPMNLPYTMDIDEAARAVLDFQPDKVFPYHYRGTEGFSDVEIFKQMVEDNSDTEVILLDWYPEN